MNRRPAMLSFIGASAARNGRRAEAQRTLDELERMHRTRYVEPFMALELCSVLGDRKQLMVWIKRAYEERSTFFLYIPMKDLYGDDPDVRAFLERRADSRRLP